MVEDDRLPSLEELDKSIKKAKIKSQDGKKASSGGATKVSIDLLSGVLVGSFVGFYLDKWLETSPWLFIICFFLGVAGSALNIYRSVERLNNKDE